MVASEMVRIQNTATTIGGGAGISYLGDCMLVSNQMYLRLSVHFGRCQRIKK